MESGIEGLTETTGVVGLAACSAQDAFALMLHSRLVDLEARVAAAAPNVLDPRVTLAPRSPEASESVYVRVRCDEMPRGGLDAVSRATLEALAVSSTDAKDVFGCWNYCGLQEGFVLELLVCSQDPLPLGRVAHAVLDSAEPAASAFVCHVHDRSWFAAAMRSAMADDAASWTWDPRTRKVETRECPWLPGDDADYTDEGARARTMLQAWLAHEREAADVYHPRAHRASHLAARLEHIVDALDASVG